jgi:hypothetical protein
MSGKNQSWDGGTADTTNDANQAMYQNCISCYMPGAMETESPAEDAGEPMEEGG